MLIIKGLFIIYWEYGTGVSVYGTKTFLMLPSMGHKDFLCFYGTGHELFLGKKISQIIFYRHSELLSLLTENDFLNPMVR